ARHQSITIRAENWIAQAAERMAEAGLFFGHGTDNAADEAYWMVLHVLGLSVHACRLDEDTELNDTQRVELDALLHARIQSRRPLAYLLGEAWFAGLRFSLNHATLVPRSPIAELIVNGLKPWLDLNRPLRVLEVGTGSGCIALALAHYWPKLNIDAVDIDRDALVMAAQNADSLGLSDRVHWFESDLYGCIDQRYDLIISNPPYVPLTSMDELPTEYHHEPRTALVAGDDGLELVRPLVLEAADHLRTDGWLLIEVGEAQPQAEQWLAPVDPVWLEFEHGGDGVFLLSKLASERLRTHPMETQLA
ncbi:MAG: 50S ribosomal protein L3 N(5)-glutamine methyltransferase, partial [Pseudomonadota bacterium]